MSYVDKVLVPGERVIFRAKLHWILYKRSIYFFVAAILALIFVLAFRKNMDTYPLYPVLILPAALIMLAFYLFVEAWFGQLANKTPVSNYWTKYVKAITCCIIAVLSLAFIVIFQERMDVYSMYPAMIFPVVFVIIAFTFFAIDGFEQFITEIVVTDRRIIYKRGFIGRHTAEMNLAQVERVDVDQSVLGRMLGYGTIHVRGSGQGLEHLHNISSPISLRTAINTAKIDH